MAGQWAVFKDIDTQSRQKLLRVRVVRFYRNPAFRNRGETLEVLFHDEQGSRMHAQIPPLLVKKYSTFFKEESVYKIFKFGVENNYQPFKIANHPYILKFMSSTLANQIKGVGFPNIMYDIKSFGQIKTEGNLDSKFLIDVIGRVVSCSEPKPRFVNEGITDVMDISLEDNEGIQLQCSLWGEYSDQMVKRIGAGLKEPLVVLIQLCRLKKNQGVNAISTAYHSTKLIFDEANAAIAHFRSKMPCNPGNLTLSCGSVLTQGESSLTQEIQNGGIEVITIEELLGKSEAGNFWILGTIVDIKDYKNWFYLACRKCNRKVNQEEDRFRCNGCNTLAADAVHRYRINVVVMDTADYTTVTLWDRESTQLLGRNITGMRSLMATRTGDPNTFPLDEIEGLILTKGLFLLSVKARTPTWSGMSPSFGVLDVILDPNVWGKYEDPAKEEMSMKLWNEEEAFYEEDEVMFLADPPSVSSCVGEKRKGFSCAEEDEAVKNLHEVFQGVKDKKMKNVKIEK